MILQNHIGLMPWSCNWRFGPNEIREQALRQRVWEEALEHEMEVEREMMEVERERLEAERERSWMEGLVQEIQRS